MKVFIYYASLVVGIIAIALYASKSNSEPIIVQTGLEQITNVHERHRLYVELELLKHKQEEEESKVWINRFMKLFRR